MRPWLDSMSVLLFLHRASLLTHFGSFVRKTVLKL